MTEAGTGRFLSSWYERREAPSFSNGDAAVPASSNVLALHPPLQMLLLITACLFSINPLYRDIVKGKLPRIP